MRDLVFIPITPCTVWDTRFATDTNSAGIIGDAATKLFYSHWNGGGGSFEFWGGNPTCPETAQNSIGGRPFAVMMTAYINDAAGNGWLTFYRNGDADPSQATISVYYSPGPTRTQTVISKSNRGYGVAADYDIAVTGRFSSANATAAVTGYFIKPQATALECGEGVYENFSVPGNFSSYHYTTATCPAGMRGVSSYCWNQDNPNIYLTGSGTNGGAWCGWRNVSASPVLVQQNINCCRVPGRP